MEEDGQIKSKLVNIDECIGIIPSLAIHLRDSSSKNAMEINNETMLPPIIHLTGSYSPFSHLDDEEDKKESTPSYHDASLVSFLCDRLHVAPSSILDFELFLYDLNVPFPLVSQSARTHRRSQAGIRDGTGFGQPRVQFLRLRRLPPSR